MKIAAAYIRVSTDEQTELSPDSQRKAIRKFAASHRYLLPEQYIFIDEGISGKDTKKRAAFHRMIETAKTKPKPFDAILLWKFSRFARNRQDSIVYKTMLRKQLGIAVISITEQLNEEPISMLMEAIIEAMDEYYSINLAEEVRRGMLERFQRGMPVSNPPLGYRIVHGTWIIDEANATAIREIFEAYANGSSIPTITKEMNQKGYTTAKGNPFDSRGIRYILQNPAYSGMLRWSSKGITGRQDNHKNLLTVKGFQKPIISQELWETVQARLHQSHAYSGSRETTQPKFMFQGLVTCSNCGGTLCYAGKNTVQCHRYTQGRCAVSHSISISKLTEILLPLFALFFNQQPNPVTAMLSDPKISIKQKNLFLQQFVHTIIFDRKQNTIRLTLAI